MSKVQNIEIINLRLALLLAGATTAYKSKPIPFKYKIKELSLFSKAAITGPVFVRLYVCSADSTDLENDPSSMRIDSEYNTEWGLDPAFSPVTLHPDYTVLSQNKCLAMLVQNGSISNVTNFNITFVIEQLFGQS